PLGRSFYCCFVPYCCFYIRPREPADRARFDPSALPHSLNLPQILHAGVISLSLGGAKLPLVLNKHAKRAWRLHPSTGASYDQLGNVGDLVEPGMGRTSARIADRGA
ncbi:MAG: hypothetical protein KA304_06265, partial [Aeromonas sp.]|nr:hypothetical protein [Aeromonas sp.]